MAQAWLIIVGVLALIEAAVIFHLNREATRLSRELDAELRDKYRRFDELCETVKSADDLRKFTDAYLKPYEDLLAARGKDSA